MAWYVPVFHFAIEQFPNFDTLKHLKSSEIFTGKDSGACKKLGALQHQTKARGKGRRWWMPHNGSSFSLPPTPQFVLYVFLSSVPPVLRSFFFFLLSTFETPPKMT